jgi:hypothetical protein
VLYYHPAFYVPSIPNVYSLEENALHHQSLRRAFILDTLHCVHRDHRRLDSNGLRAELRLVARHGFIIFIFQGG